MPDGDGSTAPPAGEAAYVIDGLLYHEADLSISDALTVPVRTDAVRRSTRPPRRPGDLRAKRMIDGGHALRTSARS